MNQHYEPNNQDNSAKYYIFTVLFLTFLISSIVGMFYFAKRNPNICACILGLYFIVFGGIFAWAGIKDKSPGSLLAPSIIIIVGLTVIIINLIYIFGNEQITIFLTERIVPILTLSIFIVVGAGMIVVPFFLKRNKKARCTILVKAKCVGLNKKLSHSKNSGSRYLYAPILSYSYYGKEYNIALNIYSNIDIPQVDSYRDIYINPNNSEETYKPSRSLEMIF